MNFFDLINADYQGVRHGGRVLFRTPSRESLHFWFNANPEPWAQHHAQNENIYYSCALMRPPRHGRGGIDDTIGVTMAWLDLDIADGAHASANCPTRAQADWILSQYPVQPSILIHSGHGLHAYWLFKHPCMFDEPDDRQVITEWMRGWQGIAKRAAASLGLSVDSTHDLARVLRVPGTINHKHGQRLPVVVERMDDVRYVRDDLTQYLVLTGTPTPPKAKSATQSGGRRDVQYQPVWGNEDDFDSFIKELRKVVGL